MQVVDVPGNSLQFVGSLYTDFCSVMVKLYLSTDVFMSTKLNMM